jgi:hypothetical protein
VAHDFSVFVNGDMAKNCSVQGAVGDCMLPLLGMFCCVLVKYSSPAPRFSEHPAWTRGDLRSTLKVLAWRQTALKPMGKDFGAGQSTQTC